MCLLLRTKLKAHIHAHVTAEVLVDPPVKDTFYFKRSSPRRQLKCPCRYRSSSCRVGHHCDQDSLKFWIRLICCNRLGNLLIFASESSKNNTNRKELMLLRTWKMWIFTWRGLRLIGDFAPILGNGTSLATVDAVDRCLSHYLLAFIHPRWWCRISSINSIIYIRIVP